MSEEKKQVLRLFKVATELGVGSSTLVDHLVKKGFEVKSNPNEKLSVEMYEVLLRDFASEKVFKEKAEQIKEKKKESLPRSEAIDRAVRASPSTTRRWISGHPRSSPARPSSFVAL